MNRRMQTVKTKLAEKGYGELYVSFAGYPSENVEELFKALSSYCKIYPYNSKVAECNLIYYLNKDKLTIVFRKENQAPMNKFLFKKITTLLGKPGWMQYGIYLDEEKLLSDSQKISETLQENKTIFYFKGNPTKIVKHNDLFFFYNIENSHEEKIDPIFLLTENFFS